MSAPRACSWEKAGGWLCPGRNSSDLLISAHPADRCLILPAVPRGRKSSAAGPGRTWQALRQPPCRLTVGFQHPGFEYSHFLAPPAARCRGEAPAAHLPLAPAGIVSWHRGHPRVLWAGGKWHGHGLGSSGIAWRAWTPPGELGHGLETMGMAWRAWTSPGELGHYLESSGIAWGARALPGECGHLLQPPGQVEQCSMPSHRCPLLRVAQPPLATPAPAPPERGPKRCKRSPRSIARSPAATPRSHKASPGSFARREAIPESEQPAERPSKKKKPSQPQGCDFWGWGPPSAGGSPIPRGSLPRLSLAPNPSGFRSRPARGVGGEGGRGCGQGSGR